RQPKTQRQATSTHRENSPKPFGISRGSPRLRMFRRYLRRRLLPKARRGLRSPILMLAQPSRFLRGLLLCASLSNPSLPANSLKLSWICAPQAGRSKSPLHQTPSRSCLPRADQTSEMTSLGWTTREAHSDRNRARSQNSFFQRWMYPLNQQNRFRRPFRLSNRDPAPKAHLLVNFYRLPEAPQTKVQAK